MAQELIEHGFKNVHPLYGGFEAWRDAHPLHARTYEEVAATWNTLRAAGPVVRAVSSSGGSVLRNRR